MKNPLTIFKGLSRGRKIGVTALLATGVFILTSAEGCDSTDPAQKQAQDMTAAYSKSAQDAVPYPLSEMKDGGWTERRLLREHLLRQNDPNGTRYVVWLTDQGQVIQNFTIKGMVFHPDSSMTNADTVTSCPNGSSTACGLTVEAPGDNGTWGPEAGTAAFFTTGGVEIQLPRGAIWIETDAPLNLTSKPLLTYNVDAKPSVDKGGLAGIGGH